MRISVSIYGAPLACDDFFLVRKFPRRYEVSFLLDSDMLDLRKSLRQNVRLALERISNLDEEPASLEAKCLKNLGRMGRQPTMIPIAISAKLDACQYARDCHGIV